MVIKPTYEELELRIKELERKAFELQLLEEASKVSAGFFNTLVFSVSNGIIVYDKDFRYKFWNKFMEKMTGLQAEYVLGKNAFDLFPHLRKEGVDILLERALAGEIVQSDDTPYYVPDTDKMGWVTGFYSPHVDINGNIVGVVAIVYDISDRKQAEGDLRASEEQYRLLLEVSPDPIVIYDMEGKAIYVNPAFSETFGWSSNELLGKRIDFVPEENWPETRAAIRRMIQGEKVQLFETKRLTKDNRKLDIQLSSSLLQETDGTPYGNMVIFRDITKQKLAEEIIQKSHDKMEQRVKERTAELVLTTKKLQQEINEHQHAEEALRESRERFRSLTEVTSDWIWEVDGNGFYTYSSPKLFDILGYRAEEIVGKTPFDFMPPVEADRVFKIFNDIRASKKSFNCLENINLHKNGRSVILETSGIPIFDTNGKFTGYRGIDRDITQRKRIQEELQKAHDELENRVKERTIELTIQKNNLEEANIALKVLLDKRQEDKKETADNLLTNVKELIAPYLKKIKKTKLDEQQKAIFSIIEYNLNEIASPFVRKMSQTYLNLTPVEIKVANLIRHGNSSKEISEIMNLSPRTIYNHRKNIRKKLGLEDRRRNLRSHLLSIF